MKRLNVRLLIILVVTVVVLTAGVVGVHAIQTGRNVDNLLSLAQEAEQAGDLRQTVNFYERYVNHEPDDLDQLAKYALVGLKYAETPDGKEYMGKAYDALNNYVQKSQARSDESHPEVREKLVDLQMKYRMFAPAKDHLLKMKAANTAAKKENPSVDLRLAKCQIATAKFSEAAKLLEPLVGYDSQSKTFDAAKAKAPNEIEAYTLLATLLLDRITDAQVANRRELADQVIDQLTKVNENNPQAILAKAQYVMPRSVDEAKPLVEQALALAPNDANAILLAVQLAMNQKDYTTAKKLLSRGVKEHPTDSRFYSTLAIAEMAENHLENAEKIVSDGLNKMPTDPALLETRFNLQLVRKDFEGAVNTLKMLDSTQTPPFALDLLQSRLSLQRGQFSEAAKMLEQLRPQVAGREQLLHQIDSLLMEAYGAMGATHVVREIAARLPADFIGAQIKEAQALVTQGKTELALARFEGIAQRLKPEQLAATAAVWRPLYELRVAEQLREPKEKQKWQQVESLVAFLREHQVLAEPNASLLDVDVLLRKGDNDTAREKLGALFKQYPDNPAVLSALARFTAQDGNTAEAMEILENAPASLQNNISLISTKIEAITSSEATAEERGRQLSKIGESVAQSPPEERAQVYSSLGIAFARAGDVNGAQQWIKKAGELRPEDVQLRWLMFDLARGAGDQPAMKELGDWFAKKFGRDKEQAKLIEAVQLVSAVREAQKAKITPNQNEIVLDASERENLKKARQLLGDVKNLRPGWHESPKLLAEINTLEGNFDEAIANLNEALLLGPPNGLMIRQLVHLLYSRNRYPEAKEILETYSSLVGRDLNRLKMVIDSEVGGGSELSAEQLDKVVDEDSTVVSDHLFRAQMYAGAGKMAEAEAAYRKAISLSPDSPEVWLAFVGHLAKQKKGAEAHQAVQEAQIQLPEDRRALTLAQGYEVLGDFGQAEQFYTSALEAATDDLAVQRTVAAYYLRTGRSALARTYLDNILKSRGSPADESDNVAWARRETAKLLAAEPDYQQFLKAMDLLKPAQGATPDPQDLALRAALLAERGEPASAREALRLLATLEQQRPLHTVERLLRARLQERLGNWSAAKDEMISLVGQSKPTPSVYAAFIEMLLRNGGANEATSWLRTLKSAAPDQPQLVPLTSRVDAELGRGKQAADNLMKELPTEKPLPKEHWKRLRATAGLLEQIKQYDQAEKLLQEYVGYVPQDSLVLAEFLGKRGKVDEAITMAEQLRRNFSPGPVLQVLLTALRQDVAPPTPQQIERAQALFERAMRDDPESSLVQIQVAGLRDFQERFEDAEKLYREILGRSETRPMDRAVVANNLAYMLAIQGKQLDEAMERVTQSLAYLGPQSDILDTRGLIYLAQGNAKQALADLTDAAIGPNPVPTKLIHLAMAQAAAGDKAGAGGSLKTANDLKFDPAELSPLERTKYDALLRQLGQST